MLPITSYVCLCVPKGEAVEKSWNYPKNNNSLAGNLTAQTKPAKMHAIALSGFQGLQFAVSAENPYFLSIFMQASFLNGENHT
ncbi:hypothetical protein [Tychonema sp. LEGE 07203]|uniref:hypothetical protein n=1 Tax=Tychonema sp. LEGE 07203 TaxID=1828671 RepID=UPI00188066CB|nr:hypothetical protein [Tychonema sp. LEGE 07203]MBE9095721.1 hypothetical protein [Tychonema sp. LEGE 07203]